MMTTEMKETISSDSNFVFSRIDEIKQKQRHREELEGNERAGGFFERYLQKGSEEDHRRLDRQRQY